MPPLPPRLARRLGPALLAAALAGCHVDALVRAPGRSPGAPAAPDSGTGAGLQLAFTAQPSNTGTLATIQPPVVVTVRDGAGRVVTSFTGTVHVAIGTDASLLHDAVLSGSTTVAVSGGTATFADLNIDQAGSGYTLTAALGSGPPAATSAAFNVGLL